MSLAREERMPERNRIADLFATLALIPHDRELDALSRDLRKLQEEFDREPKGWVA